MAKDRNPVGLLGPHTIADIAKICYSLSLVGKVTVRLYLSGGRNGVQKKERIKKGF